MDDLRLRRRVAVTSLGLAALLAGPAFAQAPDISGTYWATEYHPKIQIVGGGELPLTAAGKAAYEKNMAGLKSGTDHSMRRASIACRTGCRAFSRRPIRSTSSRRRPGR